jgi:hypothetical protein
MRGVTISFPGQKICVLLPVMPGSPHAVSIWPRLSREELALIRKLRREWRVLTLSEVVERALRELIAGTDGGREGLLVPRPKTALERRQYRIDADLNDDLAEMGFTAQVAVRAALERQRKLMAERG